MDYLDEIYWNRKFEELNSAINENKPRSSGSGHGIGIVFSSVLGAAGIVALCTLGPIDLTRVAYNRALGDMPIFKSELLDYSRREMQTKYPMRDSATTEQVLAFELGYQDYHAGERINPQKVSIGKLLDASEVHAKSWYQKWVWAKLEK
jgi:hypothetical protein